MSDETPIETPTTEQPPAKPLWLSKTLWLNVIVLLVAVLGVLAEQPILAEYTEHILGAVALLNVALRLITTQPLTTGLKR